MLTVITGPMFSGKSSALISKGISHVIAGNTVVAFKPANDSRYDVESIVTHDGHKFSAYSLPLDGTLHERAIEIFKTYEPERSIDVILIDEVQFFDKRQIYNAILPWSDHGHIIVAGLAQDSSGNSFGAMPELLSYADNIVCLKAVCSKCKKVNSATRTYRKTKNKAQVVVGGLDDFEPRCFECWNPE